MKRDHRNPAIGQAQDDNDQRDQPLVAGCGAGDRQQALPVSGANQDPHRFAYRTALDKSPRSAGLPGLVMPKPPVFLAFQGLLRRLQQPRHKSAQITTHTPAASAVLSKSSNLSYDAE